MSRERFVIVAPDRRHALCFQKKAIDTGQPGFYIAYPNDQNVLQEAGMDLPEDAIEDLIVFLHECLEVFKEPGHLGKIVLFPKVGRFSTPEGPV